MALHKGDWELYDLQADRTELHNLARTHPDKVKEMAAKYDEWASRCGVQPWEKKMIPVVEEAHRKCRAHYGRDRVFRTFAEEDER